MLKNYPVEIKWCGKNLSLGDIQIMVKQIYLLGILYGRLLARLCNGKVSEPECKAGKHGINIIYYCELDDTQTDLDEIDFIAIVIESILRVTSVLKVLEEKPYEKGRRVCIGIGSGTGNNLYVRYKEELDLIETLVISSKNSPENLLICIGDEELKMSPLPQGAYPNEAGTTVIAELLYLDRKQQQAKFSGDFFENKKSTILKLNDDHFQEINKLYKEHDFISMRLEVQFTRNVHYIENVTKEHDLELVSFEVVDTLSDQPLW